MNGMSDFEKLLDKRLTKIESDVAYIRQDLAVHKVRSGFIGAIAGALVALATRLQDILSWFQPGR